ncbi:hypothetical protein DSO57_1008107 [Entomophthora muscae]|uniref:Uncharacterized protein n=1 Tax=Entomophthora muscae TaxID=34485 RepID=A0ACC2RYB4_9FUNG|nr:hypothetical protein DSO57_1008107 [Entomophthora muscae]
MKDGELYVSPLTFEDVKEYSKINYCAKFCTDDRETKRADTTKGLVGHVHEVGRITKTCISHRLPWSVPYPEGLSPSAKLGTNKPPFSDLANALPAAVSAPSLPSLHQIPTLDSDIPPTQDCSLWLLTGAMVMALDAYSPPFLSQSPLGGPFKQLSQSCTGWHPGGWSHQDGCQTLLV